MTPRQLASKREIRRRLEVRRRDRHQPGERQRRGADRPRNAPSSAIAHAALLLLLADVDLDIDGRESGPPCRRPRTSASSSEGRSSEWMTSNRRHRLVRLVRLQPADHVQADVGMRVAQRGPFGGGFLHPAFAEIALAGGDQRLDLLGVAGLGDGDQRDLGGIAAGELGGRGNCARERQRAGQRRSVRQNLNAVPT